MDYGVENLYQYVDFKILSWTEAYRVKAQQQCQ